MKTALQFSGGKDSLALVYHLEALLPMIDVVMLDTGDLTQAAYENAKIVQKIAPNFQVVNTFPRSYRATMGQPTSTNWIQCCANNIWEPMAQFIRDMGYRQIMRGTKRCDPHLHGVYPGDIIDGAIYTMPLWDWSDDDVKTYLGVKLPQPYNEGSGSMPDCVSCPVPEACGGRTRRLWK